MKWSYKLKMRKKQQKKATNSTAIKQYTLIKDPIILI